jgi:hypothetical protein
MSVSGERFSNLDNFNKTALSGPNATRSFGTVGGAIDREARKLRRKGLMKGYEQLATAASMQRLGDRDKFGTGLVSYERRQASDAADAQAADLDNQFKSTMIDAYRRISNPEPATPAGTTTPESGIPTLLKRPEDTTPPMLRRPDEVTLPAPMGGGSATATPLATSLPTTDLGIMASQARRDKGGSDVGYRKGLDRAIGMAKSSQEVGELREQALASGITEDQFKKRIDYWDAQNKKKNSTALGRLTR